MGQMFGADVQQLRQLASTFTSAAGTLDGAASTLGPALHRSGWKGPDADRFRHEWSGRLAPRLTDTARSLTAAASVLKADADEQERTSDGGGSIGSSGGGGSWLMDAGGAAWTWGKTAWGVVGPTLKFRQLMPLMAAATAANYLADVSPAANSARVFLAGMMRDTALAGRSGLLASMLGKLGGFGQTVGKWLGPVGGLFAIGGGIHDMINPAHDGWRGVGDRVAGGLSVVAGSGAIALAFGAAAALGPIGVGVIVGAGLVAGAWALGNLVADNWDSITAGVSTAANAVASGASYAWNAGTTALSAAGNAIADGAGKVGNFIGGLFS